MTEYTIGEASQVLHVTTRTLRHWDSIGLLTPTWRTWADHRLYTEEDLETALQILIYREAGVPLREITALLTEPATALERLRRQREILEEDGMDREKITTGEMIELFGGDWQEEAEQDRFVDTLVDAATRGVAPVSAAAARLVDAHRASIDRFYDTSRSKQVLLARMYVTDERFNTTYRGHAAYLLSLVEAQAENEGLDLSDVRWY